MSNSIADCFIPMQEEAIYRPHPSISNSDLGNYKRSALYYFNRKMGQVEGISSSGFKMGTALDEMIFRPDLFEDKYILESEDLDKPSSPNEKLFCSLVMDGLSFREAYMNSYSMGKKKDEVIDRESDEKADKFAEYFRYVKELNKGRVSFSLKEKEDLLLMYNAILNHKSVNRILNESVEDGKCYNQVAIYWEEFGLNMKGLLDRTIIFKEKKLIRYYDVKYTGSFISDFIWSYDKYRYNRQHAVYASGLRHIFKGYEVEVFNIVASPQNGGECEIFKPDDEWVNEGHLEYEELAEGLLWHLENNKFEHPRAYYDNEDGVISIPYNK